LAVLVLTFKEDSLNCSLTKKAAGFSNVFILGFIMGIIPCFPLVILLGEIALISKSALAGAFYAFFFGLGTFFASLILLGAFCGISSKITTRFIKSKKANLIFRVICALFLIAFGLMLIYHRQ
jgi:sulfite exporter TauE/SafE